MAGDDSQAQTKKGSSKNAKNSKESTLKQSNAIYASAYFECNCVFMVKLSWNGFSFEFAESPAEFFAENKNIAGFDNVSD